MKRTTLAVLAVATMGVTAPVQMAQAAPKDPKLPAPYENTFSVGEAGSDGTRPWTSTTRGDYLELPYEKDGLVHREVHGFDRWNSVTSVSANEEDPGRHRLGVQNDDQTDWIFRGCPENAERAGKSSFSSEDESFHWVVDPDYDFWNDDSDDPVPGSYVKDTTHRLGEDVRSVSVEATGCIPDPGEFDGTYAHNTTHFLRTGEGEFTKVGTSVLGSTANEGGYGMEFHAEPDWEFLEQLEHAVRPDGLTDAQWADQLVAKGVVPADKRWYLSLIHI